MTDNIGQMQILISDAKKAKITSEDCTVLSVVGLIAPFMVSAREVADSLGVWGGGGQSRRTLTKIREILG